jgi:hypothetical protein
VIRSAIEELDAALVTQVGAEYVAHTRATLASLVTFEGNDA